MIERNGKFYVIAEFTDRDKAHVFDKAMHTDGVQEAWDCVVVREFPMSVQNINNSAVNGTLMQIGTITGRLPKSGGMFEGA